ncbi:MAG: GGDEF domain-containing protein [Actinobacteria bacterium]|nr:MAG: GGDEF domain-containing protein [Actinomycetota bacterium]TMM09612.1 MAG: GGDEF domain-containing protein [Actinomycetota bacterium]
MDSPISHLEDSRGEIAKLWLMRILERATLEDIERIPTGRVARELPPLISEMARALAPGAETSSSDHVEWAHRLADLTGREGPAAKDLVRDLSALQSIMLAELHRGLDRIDAVSVLATVERLAELFSALQADAVEDLLTTRSGELEWLGTTDSLTGLHNTRFMQQHLNHLLGVQKRYGHPFALLLLDIDGLKRINDAYGSSAGDRTLVGVATAVGESIRNVDTPVRMGGDEFCVLLPHQTASRARVLAERLASAIEEVDNPASQPLGVAIGVVSCPQHATDADGLLEIADGAMYRAKAAGERVAVGTDAASQNGDLIED